MQTKPRRSVYPSAVDAWLAAVLVAAPLALFIASAVASFYAAEQELSLSLLLAGIFTAALISLFSFPCFYVINADTLQIRCGLMRETISLSRIRDLRPSSSKLAAPALSLRRLRIELDNGYRLISPHDREAFTAELQSALSDYRRRHAGNGDDAPNWCYNSAD